MLRPEPSGHRDSERLLTESQRRSLSAGLQRIERELASVQTLLASTYEGEMVRFDADLAEPLRERLQKDVASARQLLRELRDRFELEPEHIAKSRWIFGCVSMLWVVAQECGTRYLRRYGRVSQELAPDLDPLVGRLADLMAAMQSATAPRSRRERDERSTVDP